MKKKVGLWIDHRNAIVVSLYNKREDVEVILSKVEKHLSRSENENHNNPYETQQIPADDIKQRVFTGELNVYYDSVVEAIRDANAIFIFGPGEAKNELKARIEKSNLGEHIVGMETADKMTEVEIVAKVKHHFVLQN